MDDDQNETAAATIAPERKNVREGSLAESKPGSTKNRWNGQKSPEGRVASVSRVRTWAVGAPIFAA